MIRPTIVLASDEPHRTIYTMLFQEAGFRVLEARTAEDVLPLARREHPAAVVLDLAARATDGVRTAERLRKTGETDGAGIVLLQPDDGPALPAALHGERVAVLRRPCGPRRVLSEVQRLAETAPEAPPNESHPEEADPLQMPSGVLNEGLA